MIFRFNNRWKIGGFLLDRRYVSLCDFGVGSGDLSSMVIAMHSCTICVATAGLVVRASSPKSASQLVMCCRGNRARGAEHVILTRSNAAGGLQDLTSCPGARRSSSSVRASARLRDASVSSGVSPLESDFDQMRRADAGDHGSTASDSHCRSGAGSLSNEVIGSAARRFRRRLVCPRLRVMRPFPDQPQGQTQVPAGFRPCLRLEAICAIDRTAAVLATKFRAAGSELRS